RLRALPRSGLSHHVRVACNADAIDEMLASPRFPLFPALPLHPPGTADRVHRREIPASNRIVSHYRQTDTRLPNGSTPVPITSSPSAARKFDRQSNCLRVPKRRAHARAIHPAEPTLCPRPVSL